MAKPLVLQIRNAAKQDFGGGERFPVLLSAELNKLGINSIILSKSKKLRSFAKQNNTTTIKSWWWNNQNWSGKRALLFPIYVFWQFILFFYYFLKFIHLNPTVVHIQSKDDFIAATFAGKILHKKIIWTDHADLKHIFKNITVWYKNPTGHLVYYAAHFTDKITVVSNSELHEIYKHLPKYSGIKNKFKVIYNGTPDKYKKQLNNNKKFTYLIASRLVRDKGVGEAIEAFTNINNKYPNTELIILGEGSDGNTFQKQAKNNINIKFLGHKSDPLKYMSKADLFLLPTYHEGFSVALVEASMLGLPVIATSVGGNVEMIKNEYNGLLVPPKSPKSLQNAMERVYKDPAFNKKLGKNNRNKYLKNYIFKDIVKDGFMPLYKLEEKVKTK